MPFATYDAHRAFLATMVARGKLSYRTYLRLCATLRASYGAL